MRPLRASTLVALVALILAGTAADTAEEASSRTAPFVRVSSRDPRYLELSDGTAYIPIGLNMIAPPGPDLDGMERWIAKLAANGGNFIRIWLGHPFFDVEWERSGVYDEDKAGRVDGLLAIAGRHGVRVKMCIESFRHFGTRDQGWSRKSLHLVGEGGPAKDIADFFDGERSRSQFRRKLDWYAARCGDDPRIFGWELWNEINAVAGGDYMAWSEVMLKELHVRFPKSLAMQSLGSYDRPESRALYRRLALMPGNDVAQVHRYLDLGARLEVCRGPVDVMAADAVRELLEADPRRPVLLAESGAVEPRHTGPFELYAKDTEGIILHDVLFAPFFAGAAGPGHIWHWDRYVDANDLWWHFSRFATAVEGLDPPSERFEPRMLEDSRLRAYVLRGTTTVTAWCRSRESDWRSELEEGRPPRAIEGARLRVSELAGGESSWTWRAYDPWKDHWSDVEAGDGRIPLPAFSRSIVLRGARAPQ